VESLKSAVKNKTPNNRNTSLISSGELKLCKQKQVVPAFRNRWRVSLSSNPFLEVLSYGCSIFITRNDVIVLLIYCVQTIASVQHVLF
jgi:hypothetical protein